MSGPDFRDLVGDDLAPEERERLERVHRLLIAAGPPPELPPELARPQRLGEEPEVVQFLPRRRRGLGLAIAATVGVLAFMGGALWGREQEDFDVFRTVQMHGVGEARAALASIEIGNESSQNIPMLIRVRGLPPLSPRGSFYELLVTKDGEPIASCGVFNTKPGEPTEVRLSVPYRLGVDQDWYDGWIVVRHIRGSKAEPIVLRTKPKV